MKLAEQIRKHRKENDLTQDQLATELHTHKPFPNGNRVRLNRMRK